MARVTRDGVTEQSVIGYRPPGAAFDQPGVYAVEAAAVVRKAQCFSSFNFSASKAAKNTSCDTN